MYVCYRYTKMYGVCIQLCRKSLSIKNWKATAVLLIHTPIFFDLYLTSVYFAFAGDEWQSTKSPTDIIFTFIWDNYRRNQLTVI